MHSSNAKTLIPCLLTNLIGADDHYDFIASWNRAMSVPRRVSHVWRERFPPRSETNMSQPIAQLSEIPCDVSNFENVSLRQSLRDATQDIHQGLHLHPGFLAIQNGTIDAATYRDLLARLYGFYLTFEPAAKIMADRSAWLQEDLAALSVTNADLAAIPRCTDFPVLDDSESQLGARYVVEGSSLGGLSLARNLDSLLGADVQEGRRFFVGRGPGGGQAWKGLLTGLKAVERDPVACRRVIAAAIATFQTFAFWMNGWRAAEHD
jgi:heme oxygenase